MSSYLKSLHVPHMLEGDGNHVKNTWCKFEHLIFKIPSSSTIEELVLLKKKLAQKWLDFFVDKTSKLFRIRRSLQTVYVKLHFSLDWVYDRIKRILWKVIEICMRIDPLSQHSVTAGRDHCFLNCHPSFRQSVPTFQNLVKQNKVKTMFATGETVGLAEWIIDDTWHLVSYIPIYPLR